MLWQLLPVALKVNGKKMRKENNKFVHLASITNDTIFLRFVLGSIIIWILIKYCLNFDFMECCRDNDCNETFKFILNFLVILSETAEPLCHLLFGNDKTNQQWAIVRVVLCSKAILKFVKYKFSKVALEKPSIKEVTDFMYIRLQILKCSVFSFKFGKLGIEVYVRHERINQKESSFVTANWYNDTNTFTYRIR